MNERPTNVRIGPISLFALISVLLLSVLAVLCVTSANATATMSARQADAVAETYRLDARGQDALAVIDKALHAAQPASASDAADAAAGRLHTDPGLPGGGDDGIDVDARADGARIDLTVSAESGKALNAVVRVNDDATYTVDEWKIAGVQAEPDETLWSNANADR